MLAALSCAGGLGACPLCGLLRVAALLEEGAEGDGRVQVPMGPRFHGWGDSCDEHTGAVRGTGQKGWKRRQISYRYQSYPIG